MCVCVNGECMHVYRHYTCMHPTGRETSSDRLDGEIRLGLHLYRALYVYACTYYTCMHSAFYVYACTYIGKTRVFIPLVFTSVFTIVFTSANTCMHPTGRLDRETSSGRLDREISSDRLDREIRLGLHVYRHYTCMHARIIRVCIRQHTWMHYIAHTCTLTNTDTHIDTDRHRPTHRHTDTHFTLWDTIQFTNTHTHTHTHTQTHTDTHTHTDTLYPLGYNSRKTPGLPLRERPSHWCVCVCVCVCAYIYIYIPIA